MGLNESRIGLDYITKLQYGTDSTFKNKVIGNEIIKNILYIIGIATL